MIEHVSQRDGYMDKLRSVWPKVRLYLLVTLLLPLLLSAETIDRQQAVQMARDGDTASALTALEKAYQKSPDDLPLLYDYITVLSWAGKDREVDAMAIHVDPMQVPAYVLKAIAKSERNLQAYAVSASLYDLGITRFPDDRTFYIGSGYVLADQKKLDEAGLLFERAKKRFPDDMDLRFEEARMYEEHRDYFDAMLSYQELLRYPEAYERSVKQLVDVLRRLGMPFVAQRYIDRDPDLFTEEERRAIINDQSAFKVRWDKEGFTDEKDFTRLESTLAGIDAELKRFEGVGDERYQERAYLQSNFDKIAALAVLDRKREIVRIYRPLREHGVIFPDHVMRDVADAYLALDRPEVARPILEGIVSRDPNDFRAKVLLFYAYSDAYEMHKAMEYADRMYQSEPVQIGRSANTKKSDFHLLSIQARQYSGYLDEAQEALEALVEQAPDNHEFRTTLGALYRSRGWYARALEQYKIVLNHSPDDFYAAKGKIETLMAQRRYVEAKAALDALSKKNPKEQFQLNKVHEEYEKERKALFYLDNSLGKDPGQFSQSDNQSFDVQGVIYTPLVADHWRGLVFTEIARSEFTDEERFTNRRYGAGVNYSDAAFDIELKVAYNTTGVKEIAFGADGTYCIDDYLSIFLGFEKFSADTPLRAIDDGVTADTLRGGVSYQSSESRSSTLEYVFMTFEDDNQRDYLGLRHHERLIPGPYYELDGYLYLNGSRNSQEEVAYYNPEQEVHAGAKANNGWRLFYYKRVGLRQILGLEGGTHYEKGYGSQWTGAVSLEQQWEFGEDFGLGYGYTRRRATYDGNVEYGSQFYLNINGRF